jgi:hypothetical protein
VSKIPAKDFKDFEPTAGYRGRGFCTGQTTKKQILRLATLQERASLIEKVRDEDIALQVVLYFLFRKSVHLSVITEGN